MDSMLIYRWLSGVVNGTKLIQRNVSAGTKSQPLRSKNTYKNKLSEILMQKTANTVVPVYFDFKKNQFLCKINFWSF